MSEHKQTLKFATSVAKLLMYVHLWERKVAQTKIKLLLLTIIARWEAKSCKLLPRQKLRRKVARRDFSQSRQARKPTHARRHSPAMHTRETPATDERPSQNNCMTKGITCDGPAVSDPHVERVYVCNLCKSGFEVFLVSIICKNH